MEGHPFANGPEGFVPRGLDRLSFLGAVQGPREGFVEPEKDFISEVEPYGARLTRNVALSVFISHCTGRADATVVSDLASRLKDRGIDAYLAERDPQPGKSLSAKILEKIRSSDLFAVLWTRDGSSSAWVNQEAGAANAEGKVVIPIVEIGVRVVGALEGLEYIEFDRANPSGALDSLETYLQRRAESEKNRGTADTTNAVLNAVLIALAIVAIIVLILVLLWAASAS